MCHPGSFLFVCFVVVVIFLLGFFMCMQLPLFSSQEGRVLKHNSDLLSFLYGYFLTPDIKKRKLQVSKERYSSRICEILPSILISLPF